MRELETVLKALADRKRLRILKMLQKQKLCVCELAFVLGITQPSVSRHLKKLKKAGLIKSEQNGFWTDYYLAPDGRYADTLIRHLKGWCNNDTEVIQDAGKVKNTDRQKLCCRK